MGESPAGLCVAACHSLGDLGGPLFTVLAIVWGAWQAYQRSKAAAVAIRATVEKDNAVMALANSLRPTEPYKPSLQTLEGKRALPPLPIVKGSDRESGG